MEQGLKERLTGAAVIVILAVIFIPMLLDDTEDQEVVITETNIPPKPENMPSPPAADERIVPPESDFSSRIIPVEPVVEEAGQEPEPVAREKDEIAPPVEKPETPASEAAPATGQKSAAAVSKSEEPPNNVGLSAWVVQLGSFSSEKNAQELNQKLKKAGFRSFVEPLKQNNTTSYRVRVGPELKRSDAQAIRDKLKNTLQLEGIIVTYP